MISIGVDPGLHGAVVAVNEHFKLVDFFDCPVIKNEKTKKGKKSITFEFAPAVMADYYLRLLKDTGHPTGYVKAWLEKAGAMPQQGLSSTFKTGRGFGIWEGILAASGAAWDVVGPRIWSKEMFKGTPLGDTKQRSLTRASRLLPDLPLTRSWGRVLSLDGRSDAALIACYGMMQMTQTGCKLDTRTPVRIKKK